MKWLKLWTSGIAKKIQSADSLSARTFIDKETNVPRFSPRGSFADISTNPTGKIFAIVARC